MRNILILLSFVYQVAASAMPGQVIIIRHGEKDTLSRELTGAGIERAEALASYLTISNSGPGFVGNAGLTNVALFNFGPPVSLFAARPIVRSDDFTVRCIQTLVPTALKLNIPIHSPYAPGQEQKLVDYILNEKLFDGKNVVICWHHTSIATLIRTFGYIPVGIEPTYPDRFDLVWLLPMPAPVPAASVTAICQDLLYGDNPVPP